jgi:hypothetical protein
VACLCRRAPLSGWRPNLTAACAVQLVYLSPGGAAGWTIPFFGQSPLLDNPLWLSGRPLQVADLQLALREEQFVVDEKKATTLALIESIGQEKAVVDEAVEASRGDEEQAAQLQVVAPLKPVG